MLRNTGPATELRGTQKLSYERVSRDPRRLYKLQPNTVIRGEDITDLRLLIRYFRSDYPRFGKSDEKADNRLKGCPTEVHVLLGPDTVLSVSIAARHLLGDITSRINTLKTPKELVFYTLNHRLEQRYFDAAVSLCVVDD
jgi:hypothetical protein